MKHKLLIAAAATALMAAPSFASAQDGSGWYLKGAAGYGAGTDIDITGGVVGDVEAQGDIATNLGLGYDFGQNWRLELDGTSMWNDYGAIAQGAESAAKVRTDALMLNAIYDFNDFGKFAPYVGAGVGVVRADASVFAHDFLDQNGFQAVNPICIGTRDGVNASSCDYNDEDTGLGWQLLAGLGYDITDNLTWDTNYRYMQATDLDLDGGITNGATGVTLPGQVELDGVGAHQLLTGFRYRFGAAAPKMVKPEPVVETADYKCWDGSMVFNAGQCPAEVVEPVADVRCWDGSMVFDSAQCPVEPVMVTCPDGSVTSDINYCPVVETVSGCGEQYRQEIIYYEFDKGASAETRNTITRILDAGQFCSVDAIRVVGHTDTSGAASYNLALSKRRANDALNELVRQGVARGTITAEGKGETEPFVQTGDGVKEQLNRRTEVLLTLGSIDAMVN
ncbi:MAG: outer membrane beta-barrel protein [Litorimonas sp.]